MSVLISYFFLGISLAAPIGPINAAQLDRGIKYGFFNAWLIGLGSVAADLVYMLVVYFGLIHILDIPFVKAFLWLFGFFVLTYTGIESLKSTGQITNSRDESDESYKKSFSAGFLMAISNPLTILFWLGIYGSILANTAATASLEQLAIYSCAIIAGLVLWDVSMAALSSSFRKFLSPGFLTSISILSGVSLIGFGLYFGYQGFILLFG
ncbi:LysE family transporter [Bacillus luteolus]|uniref:LysE family transporter n=1 Tax=Litchfieldia luteola TaxID=682179 RepID=A0ABR9QE13_9BACI|nr:LysE family transporter [Cytobacillus luteolus]MBE4906732.1 LysE family transporter [Cytobacillus luteolus]MBP1940618.1 threonine/homoserine/homoserine lactone efflux protein [Cytobacillus luteolus]